MKQHNKTAPLVRRRKNDPKRPWLDWRADEPLPAHLMGDTKTPKPKRLWKAIVLLWALYFAGLHRFYIGDKKGGWLWVLGVIAFTVAGLYFMEFGPEGRIYTLCFGAIIIGLFIREYGVLKAGVMAYNHEHFPKARDNLTPLKKRTAVLLLLFIPVSGAHRIYVEDYKGAVRWIFGAISFLVLSEALIKASEVTPLVGDVIQLSIVFAFFIREYFVLKRGISDHNQAIAQ